MDEKELVVDKERGIDYSIQHHLDTVTCTVHEETVKALRLEEVIVVSVIVKQTSDNTRINLSEINLN